MLKNKYLKRWTYNIFAPDLLQREIYEAFKRLLAHDRSCHELMADLQDLYYQKTPTEWIRVVQLYDRLSIVVAAMLKELSIITPENVSDLQSYFKKFDSYSRFLLEPKPSVTTPPYVLWLGDPRITPSLTGNKAANLSIIKQTFEYHVPSSFVITAHGWHVLVEYNNLRDEIDSLCCSLDPHDSNSIRETSRTLIAMITGAKIPPELDDVLREATAEIVATTKGRGESLFAVRSSAVNEDGINSFAGQYRSVLDSRVQDIRTNYLYVLASKYTPRALLYRIAAGISDREASMAVLVMEMIAPKAAGVMYTEDPTGEFEQTISIYSVSGQGEKLVGGTAPSHRTLFNKKSREISDQSEMTHLYRDESLHLVDIACDLENHFGTSQDIEWAVDADTTYILQSRPLKTERAVSMEDVAGPDSHQQDGKEPDLPLLYHGGLTAARGTGVGRVYVLSEQGSQLLPEENNILIVENIPASLIVILPKCTGVIARRGSVASHFSTICREFGVPLLVCAEGISEKITQGQVVTLDADRQQLFEGYDPLYSLASEASNTKKTMPFYRRLQPILDFITPLNLLDPGEPTFAPEFCRSFHDIVRYTHEKGVQAMFALGKFGSRKNSRKHVTTQLPFDLYLIDVEGDALAGGGTEKNVTVEQVNSTPFQALWRGLSHPSIAWGDHEYYNWKEYDSAAMTDGFAFKNKTESASYAICGNDYLNLNMRFGYHFTLIDTLCGENSDQNYCSIRFAGGGGTFEGRYYRLEFIEAILKKVGFQVTTKVDLIDARLDGIPVHEMSQALTMLGRMLGTTKLMDMVLKDEDSVRYHLEKFFDCNDDNVDQESDV